MKSTSSDQLAILIDGDNVSPKIIDGLMIEVANYGNASVRRIYGDWTSPHMKSWRDCLLKHSITPSHSFAYSTGKNATDGAMIIDAMDLMYTGRFASFCLVSSDSDFTRLAARIREQGVSVYGFGHRKTAHRALIAACNEFVFFDALPEPPEELEEASTTQGVAVGAGTAPASTQSLPVRSIPTGPKISTKTQINGSPQHAIKPGPLDKTVIEGLKKAIRSCSYYEDDYVNLAEVGIYLVRISPDLNARNYGFQRLRDFIEASGIVHLKMKSLVDRPPVALVRLKEKD